MKTGLMLPMNILTWIIFGGLIGTVAHLLDPGDERSSLLGTVVLGVLGALVGGLLANLVFGVNVSGFNFASFAVAILGALLLMFVQRAVRRT